MGREEMEKYIYIYFHKRNKRMCDGMKENCFIVDNEVILNCYMNMVLYFILSILPRM